MSGIIETGRKTPFGRKTLSLSPRTLVRHEPSGSAPGFPVLVRPSVEGVDLRSWLKLNAAQVEEWLLKYGGILFRGFDIEGPRGFEEAFQVASGELLEYKERSSPRHAVQGRIYTSTDLPSEQSIFPHNENSYQHTWPLRIGFFCVTPAAAGGETPLLSSRLLGELVPASLRARFEQKGLLYVRRYSGMFGLSWQEAFQTEDPEDVEAYCRAHRLQTVWRDGELETRSLRPAVTAHPASGELLWFNHAVFFHASGVPEEVASVVLAQFGRDHFPNDVRFGDGSPIEDSVIQELRSIYQENKVRFPWEKSDLLLLDNMLTLHGREPFEGERKVVVAMARAHTAD